MRLEILKCDVRMHKRTHGKTDRREVQNNYLDLPLLNAVLYGESPFIYILAFLLPFSFLFLCYYYHFFCKEGLKCINLQFSGAADANEINGQITL